MLLHYQGCRLFQSLRFRNVLQKVQRRFCADSKSKKSDAKLPSGRPSHASECPSVSRSFNCSKLHPSGRSSVFGKKSDFLLRHRYEKTVASVRMSGLHHPDAILDKASRGEELQPSGRQGNTVQTPVLIMEFTCSRSATVQTLGQHCLDAALIWYCVKCVMESRLYSCSSGHFQLPSEHRLEKSVPESI
jgi:hypothetical protein